MTLLLIEADILWTNIGWKPESRGVQSCIKLSRLSKRHPEGKQKDLGKDLIVVDHHGLS